MMDWTIPFHHLMTISYVFIQVITFVLLFAFFKREICSAGLWSVTYL